MQVSFIHFLIDVFPISILVTRMWTTLTHISGCHKDFFRKLAMINFSNHPNIPEKPVWLLSHDNKGMGGVGCGGCRSNVMTEAEKEPRHLLFCFRVCGHMISWEFGAYAGIFFLWIAEGYKPDSNCKITKWWIHTHVKSPNCNLPQLTILLIFNENLEAQWLGLRAFATGAGVPSMVGDLRSCKPRGVDEKKNNNI